MSDSHRFPVDLTAIMLFASALGETNPIYYDEERAAQTPLGGVIAPPTFSISSGQWNPNYPFRGIRQIPAPPPAAEETKPEQKPTGEKGKPEEKSGGGGLTRLLHGEQRFEYHKPLRPGMRLEVSSRPGKSWEKQGRRGGTMKFTETITELRDENGELVVTQVSVGIMTGKAVEG
jgi:acyl dehydratase